MYFKKKNGFTLIELLMVISIISLLTTIIFSYTSETRAKARDSVRLSDMKQVGTAMQMYYQDTGRIPTSFGDLVPNYLPSIPVDPGTHSVYNFASTTKTVVVSAIYENQYINETDKKSVGVAIGDTDISTLCSSEFVYPNCSDDGSPIDQVVFISTGIIYSGGGEGTNSPTTHIPVHASFVNLSDNSVRCIKAPCPQPLPQIISWDVFGVDSCTASGGSEGWAGSKDASNGLHEWPITNMSTSGTYTYTISCNHGDNIFSDEVTVNVVVPTVSIYNNSPKCIGADCFPLPFSNVGWEVYNVESCTASGGSDGWEGSKDSSDGKHEWSLPSKLTNGIYTYSISCNYGSEIVSDSLTITVSPIVLLFASEFGIGEQCAGGCTSKRKINWQVFGVESCTGSGGSEGWLGTKDVSAGPHQWKTGDLDPRVKVYYTYTLSCTTSTGENISRSIKLTIPPSKKTF
ncbi:MAG: type II secretion system protein [Candidatus Taylorbacteria bacterium]|nr:type II secretion system protein [Candidatus Taylorbacteria bacterium]